MTPPRHALAHRSLALLALVLVLTHAGCVEQPDDPETATSSQELVQGPPQIISTSLNAPLVAGQYQLLSGKAYTATVVVDAGTITYLTRVEPDALPPWSTISPATRDDTVVAYAGTYIYTFTITTSTPGNWGARFRIRDRGSNLIYNYGNWLAVNVSSTYAAPRIASTTINAPIWAGRYQLYAGQSYQVTVRVAMSNVTYNARVEGNGNSATLHINPSASNYVSMPQFGADQIYTFTMVPDTIGQFQVAFRLRDLGTGNVFAADGGVATAVNGTAAPRITNTTIEGVTADPITGQYRLTIGQRYKVVVHVDPGSAPYTAAVEANDELPAVPNLHNRRTTHVLLTGPRDFHFTLTPTSPGQYQVGFMMRDCLVGAGGACTGSAFSKHAGIPVVAYTPFSAPGPLYGYVTKVSNGAPVPYANVVLETGVSATARWPDGRYYFASVPPGEHTLTVTAPSPPGGYSTTIVTHLTVPAAGIRVDVDLEEFFTSLSGTGITYARYIDYLSGRALLHVVNVPRATARVELRPSPPGGYATALQMANTLAPAVTINAGYFEGSAGVDRNGTPCTAAIGNYIPTGYRWPMAGYHTNGPCQFGISTTETYRMPVLGITGTSINQTFQIEPKSIGFDTTDWKPQQPVQPGWPIWDDVPPSGASDVNYAVQAYPMLVEGGSVTPDWLVEGDSFADPDQHWARTAVGLTTTGDMLMVVADGEGFTNCEGANWFVVARFFQDVLPAARAMGLDGGGSSSIVIRRNNGTRAYINTPTSETLLSPGAPTTLLDFLMAW